MSVSSIDQKRAILAHNRAANELAKAFMLHGLECNTAHNVALRWTNAALDEVSLTMQGLLRTVSRA
jgi:hypothetical protein